MRLGADVIVFSRCQGDVGQRLASLSMCKARVTDGCSAGSLLQILLKLISTLP